MGSAHKGVSEGICGEKPCQQGQTIRGQKDFSPADPSRGKNMSKTMFHHNLYPEKWARDAAR
eukprot:8916135-Ditylum_brightwellii.AAC.1